MFQASFSKSGLANTPSFFSTLGTLKLSFQAQCNKIAAWPPSEVMILPQQPPAKYA
jgi:hypothetical protein